MHWPRVSHNIHQLDFDCSVKANSVFVRGNFHVEQFASLRMAGINVAVKIRACPITFTVPCIHKLRNAAETVSARASIPPVKSPRALLTHNFNSAIAERRIVVKLNPHGYCALKPWIESCLNRNNLVVIRISICICWGRILRNRIGMRYHRSSKSNRHCAQCLSRQRCEYEPRKNC